MASQLILDRADPGIDQIVSKWENGQSYPIPIGQMTQVASDPKRAIFDIVSVESEEAPNAEAAVEAEEPPAPKSKPAVEVRYGSGPR